MDKMKGLLPRDLRDVFMQRWDYDQQTGIFTWKVSPCNNVKIGSVAGSKTYGVPHLDYIRLECAGQSYAAHRVAWLFVHSKWPDYEIDHINGCRTDNRIVNLRDVPHSMNQQNVTFMKKLNQAGLTGVRASRGDTWRATIRHGGKQHHLGIFATREAAFAAYIAAKRRMHPESGA